jgi:short-subunit dehydrogenase
MDLDLRGQSVLITGGSQGIGLATARAFAAEGCHHLHLAARTESRLREAQRDITEKFGGRVDIHPIDVAIGENAKPLARDCCDDDILVNNAGAARAAAGGLAREPGQNGSASLLPTVMPRNSRRPVGVDPPSRRCPM